MQRYKYDKCDLNSGNCTFLLNFVTIPHTTVFHRLLQVSFLPTLIYPFAPGNPPLHVGLHSTKIIGRLLLPIPATTLFFFTHKRRLFFSLASNDQQELLDSSFRLLSNVTTAKGGAPQARNCVRLRQQSCTSKKYPMWCSGVCSV